MRHKLLIYGLDLFEALCIACAILFLIGSFYTIIALLLLWKLLKYYVRIQILLAKERRIKRLLNHVSISGDYLFDRVLIKHKQHKLKVIERYKRIHKL